MAYEVRGYDYVNDYKNGGVHDVVTVVVIYSALIAFVVLCCAALVRAMRTVLNSLGQPGPPPSRRKRQPEAPTSSIALPIPRALAPR